MRWPRRIYYLSSRRADQQIGHNPNALFVSQTNIVGVAA